MGPRDALGAPEPEGRVLEALGRRRGGLVRYAIRSAAFRVAASPAGVRWLPYPLRRRAVNALLDLVFRDPSELMLYAGLTDSLESAPCRGLLER